MHRPENVSCHPGVVTFRQHPVGGVHRSIDPVGGGSSHDLVQWFTLLGTNISHPKALLKMIFLFPRWDMLAPWRVITMVMIW